MHGQKCNYTLINQSDWDSTQPGIILRWKKWGEKPVSHFVIVGLQITLIHTSRQPGSFQITANKIFEFVTIVSWPRNKVGSQHTTYCTVVL